jgi:hypothetical protein
LIEDKKNLLDLIHIDNNILKEESVKLGSLGDAYRIDFEIKNSDSLVCLLLIISYYNFFFKDTLDDV